MSGPAYQQFAAAGLKLIEVFAVIGSLANRPQWSWNAGYKIGHRVASRRVIIAVSFRPYVALLIGCHLMKAEALPE